MDLRVFRAALKGKILLAQAGTPYTAPSPRLCYRTERSLVPLRGIRGTNDKATHKPGAWAEQAGSMGDAHVSSSYSLRILLVFPSYSLGVLFVFIPSAPVTTSVATCYRHRARALY